MMYIRKYGYTRIGNTYYDSDGNVVYLGCTLYNPTTNIKLVEYINLPPFSYHLDNYNIDYVHGLHPIICIEKINYRVCVEGW